MTSDIPMMPMLQLRNERSAREAWKARAFAKSDIASADGVDFGQCMHKRVSAVPCPSARCLLRARKTAGEQLSRVREARLRSPDSRDTTVRPQTPPCRNSRCAMHLFELTPPDCGLYVTSCFGFKTGQTTWLQRGRESSEYPIASEQCIPHAFQDFRHISKGKFRIKIQINRVAACI